VAAHTDTVADQSDETLRRPAMKIEPVLASAALAVALLCSGAPAFAGDRNTDQEARISLTDLNLATARGADLLDVRIEAASRDLCRNARRPASRLSDRAFCQAAVRAEVMRQLPAGSQRDYAQARQPRIDL
jgi:UrcA family protein